VSTSAMTKPLAEMSPRFKARIAGISYLLTGTTYLFGQMFVLGRVVVEGNATATANNILAHQPLFRSAFAANLLSIACSIVLTVLFYDLFKPVNRTLSLTAAFVHLVGLAVAAVGSLFLLAPLGVLDGGQHLSAFKAERLQALASVFLKLNAQDNFRGRSRNRSLGTSGGLQFLHCLLPERLWCDYWSFHLTATSLASLSGGERAAHSLQRSDFL
jgi:hypothetical protein